MRFLLAILCLFLIISVSTAYRTIVEETSGRVPSGWQRIQKADAEEPLSLIIALKQRNVDELLNQLQVISDPDHELYGKHMTIDQINELVRLEDHEIQSVMNALVEHGIESDSIKLLESHDFIRVDPINVKQAEQLLDITFHVFEQAELKQRVVRTTDQYSLPTDIARYVDFVGGISRFPARSMKVSQPNLLRPTPRYVVDPPFIKRMYDIPSHFRGNVTSNNQAVVEFLEQYYNNDDLQTYLGKFGLAPQNVARLVGPNNSSNPGGEAQLDIQVIMGVSPYVPTEFWSFAGRRDNKTAPSKWNQEPFLEWMIQLNTDQFPPLVNSVSYDDDEATLSSAYMNRLNNEFIKAGLRGITLIFAAGDDGIGGIDVRENPANCVRAEPAYPSSSPYVLSVGGTQLNDQNQEVVSDSKTGSYITTGGGFSYNFSVPWYQKTQVQQYLQQPSANLPPGSFFNPQGRVFPDISAIATNYIIVMNGKDSYIGGTSASTPVIASMIALFNDIRLSRGQPPMGFINPWLYSVASRYPGTVNDIIDGNNACSAYPDKCCPYGFHATPGFDAVTGLGTPVFVKLMQYL